TRRSTFRRDRRSRSFDEPDAERGRLRTRGADENGSLEHLRVWSPPVDSPLRPGGRVLLRAAMAAGDGAFLRQGSRDRIRRHGATAPGRLVYSIANLESQAHLTRKEKEIAQPRAGRPRRIGEPVPRAMRWR